MVTTVFLKTDKFEVQLEGITFKAKDFQPFCATDFLFPKGKTWNRPPVVGVDVVQHPRRPDTALLLMNFGVGCVILRFPIGESLPNSVIDFLMDERIIFAGFGIPEKNDLFPFDKLGLIENKIDVGYLAAEYYNDPSLQKCGLATLARRVIGVRKMTGLTQTDPQGGRNEDIKCAMCEVFISALIGSALEKKKSRGRGESGEDSPIKGLPSFMKLLNCGSMPGDSWSKIINKKRGEEVTFDGENPKSKRANNNFEDCISSPSSSSRRRRPLKSILKSPSFKSLVLTSQESDEKHEALRRANSKGHNVSFK